MIGRTVVRQYTKSARESTYVEFRRLSRTMASLAESDALLCKIKGNLYNLYFSNISFMFPNNMICNYNMFL